MPKMPSKLPSACVLALVLGASCAVGQFTDVYSAIVQLNCANLQQVLDVPSNAGIKALLTNSSLQVVFLAPQDVAFTTPEFSFISQLFSGNSMYLFNHMIPQAEPQAQLDVTDGVTLSTLFPSDPLTLANVTIRSPSNTNQAVALGLAPGAQFNPSRSYVAGQSRVYLVSNLILPPSQRVINNRTLPGLTIQQALANLDPQVFGTWAMLVAADPIMANTTMDPDQAITMLVPTNLAMQKYFTCLGSSVTALKGSPAARTLIQEHVLPGQPWALRNFPSSGQVPSGSGDVLITSVGGAGGPAVSIGGQAVINNLSNVWAGKSILHVLDGVITKSPLKCGSSAPSPAALIVDPTSPSGDLPGAAPASSGGDSPDLAVVGGAVAGAVVGAILLGVGIAFFVWRRYKSSSKQEKQRLTNQGSTGKRSKRTSDGLPRYGSGRNGRGAAAREQLGPAGGITKSPISVQGFVYGDQFVRCTAPQYSWTDLPSDGPTPGVEAGINDLTLDASVAHGLSPIIRLTRTDVVKQIKLLKSGLLGRGATACVFKCQWPSRFGPNALLAVKLLKDPYEADPSVYEAFCYEAAVLASVRHPNVVRTYGFCLELPTACIIMELCPGTLKDRLYRRPPGTSSLSPSLSASANLATRVESKTSLNSSGLGNGKSVVSPKHVSTDRSKSLPLDKGDLSEVVSATGIAMAVPEDTVAPAASAYLSPWDQQQAAALAAGGGVRARGMQRSTLVIPKQASVAPITGNINPTYNCLTMIEVLQLAADVAAGLAYLHRRPAVMALPTHPTLMLEPATVDNNDDTLHFKRVSAMQDDDEGDDEGKAVARIVHRDLKPSNILINSHGRCKISDFGLARWHSNTTVHTGTLGVGTLRYMAPELLLGHYSGRTPESDPVTNKVDIYSLGMLCWEMATSQMPWTDLSDAQIVAAVINQKRPNLEGTVSDIVEPEVDLSDKDALPALLKAYNLDDKPSEPSEGPELPATLAGFPALLALINSCWQQTDGKRPNARMAHRVLCALSQAYGYGQNTLAGAPSGASNAQMSRAVSGLNGGSAWQS